MSSISLPNCAQLLHDSLSPLCIDRFGVVRFETSFRRLVGVQRGDWDFQVLFMHHGLRVASLRTINVSYSQLYGIQPHS